MPGRTFDTAVPGVLFVASKLHCTSVLLPGSRTLDTAVSRTPGTCSHTHQANYTILYPAAANRRYACICHSPHSPYCGGSPLLLPFPRDGIALSRFNLRAPSRLAASESHPVPPLPSCSHMLLLSPSPLLFRLTDATTCHFYSSAAAGTRSRTGR